MPGNSRPGKGFRWAEHDAVLGAALMARGVIDVRDNLQITG
jgi:hypothetical protein